VFSNHPTEINIIERLLQKEYPSFLKNSLPLSIVRIRDLIKSSQGAVAQNIKIESIKDNQCLRIKLPHPISLLVPQSTHMLNSRFVYYPTKSIPSAFLAAYVVELNHFTMLRLYGHERIQEYFPDHNNASFTRDVYDHFSFNTESVPEYSSLNFLLRQKAHSTVPYLPNETKAIDLCFEHAYWHVPLHNICNEYDTFHNFIYNSTRKLRQICDVFKTLVKIERVYTSQHELNFLNRPFKYKQARVKILYDGTKHDCLETDIYVVGKLASDLRPGHIINAIMVNIHAFQHNDPKSKLLLVNKIGPIMTSPDTTNFKALVSVIAHLHCKHVPSINFVETIQVDELASKLKSVLEIEGFFDSRWSSSLTRDYVDVSITALHPLLLKHDDDVHIVPPALVNHLATHTKSISWDFLNAFISLMRNLPFDSTRTMYSLDRSVQNNIRLSSSYAALQKIDLTNNILKTFFQDLPPLLNYIVYSRILSRSSKRAV